jgi:ABC-2 type transport system ATP-binding protein
MQPVLKLQGVCKTWPTGLKALNHIDLEIRRGEIFALLGPNGAGKTTLISIICGMVNASSGKVLVNGLDHVQDFREARKLIGLVPQELSLNIFEKVIDTVRFSRGLFGRAPDDARVESILKSLSLWEKRDQKIMALSGGMKRRVLIAKALAHDPEILFLDEPTAGVDVELRRDMWEQIRLLREQGVTIILTTHYIEEAEDMADRVGVINKGEIMLVEEKNRLMQKLGKKQLTLNLAQPITTLPAALAHESLELLESGSRLLLSVGTAEPSDTVARVLKALHDAGITIVDIDSRQSSLEEIFVELLEQQS